MVVAGLNEKPPVLAAGAEPNAPVPPAEPKPPPLPELPDTPKPPPVLPDKPMPLVPPPKLNDGSAAPAKFALLVVVEVPVWNGDWDAMEFDSSEPLFAAGALFCPPN